MYAVIQDRGRQYRAAQGDKLVFDRSEAEPGTTLELPVLLVSENGAVKVGAPYVAGAKAVVKVLSHTAGDKLRIGKFKRRKHMTLRSKGFRAAQTMVEVVSISH